MKPLAIIFALAAAASAEDIIPQALPTDRYAETIGKSPFVLETKAVEQAVVPDNAFANLYLRGVGKADGQDYVLIQRLGEERTMRYIGKDPGPDEFSVKEVRMGTSFRDTRVVLQKGTATEEIKFKEDTLNAPPAAPQPRGIALPGQFPKAGGPNPQPGAAPRVIAQPGTTIQPVPRPGGSVPLPQMKSPQPGATPQLPGPPRGRSRPIGN